MATFCLQSEDGVSSNRIPRPSSAKGQRRRPTKDGNSKFNSLLLLCCPMDVTQFKFRNKTIVINEEIMNILLFIYRLLTTATNTLGVCLFVV